MSDYDPENPEHAERNRKYQREWYKRNRELQKQRVAEQRAKRRLVCDSWVAGYLKSHPCVDCSESDIVVLDFDHLRDKSYAISYLIKEGLLDKLKIEIGKCEVRCANCHRRKTARESGNWRLEFRH